MQGIAMYYILITKSNCTKCDYVKVHANMSNVITWNLDLDTTWGGNLHKGIVVARTYPCIGCQDECIHLPETEMFTDITLDEAREIITMLTLEREKIYQVGATIMPLLMSLGGEILAKGAGRCIKYLKEANNGKCIR
jgi:hypothetical protein